jgi:hypothetical protein
MTSAPAREPSTPRRTTPDIDCQYRDSQKRQPLTIRLVTIGPAAEPPGPGQARGPGTKSAMRQNNLFSATGTATPTYEN